MMPGTFGLAAADIGLANLMLSEANELEPTDAQLVSHTLSGDRAAFACLYDRYARLVRAICYNSTGNITEALDLAQEVFLRVHAKLAELKDHDRFAAWLVSITRNVCREYRRSKARDRHVLVGLQLEHAAEPDDQEDTQKDLARMAQAMQKLPERERLALDVYYLQNQDANQAARIMGTSRSGLYRLLEKARKKIKKLMKELQE